MNDVLCDLPYRNRQYHRYWQSFSVGDEILNVIHIIRVLMMVGIKSHFIHN